MLPAFDIAIVTIAITVAIIVNLWLIAANTVFNYHFLIFIKIHQLVE